MADSDLDRNIMGTIEPTEAAILSVLSLNLKKIDPGWLEAIPNRASRKSDFRILWLATHV
jgi:hypothetical protein